MKQRSLYHLVLLPSLSAARSGVWSDVKFFKKDLWRFNISPYSHIVIFGVDCMMEQLEKKILAESQEKCTVVACRFPFPTLQPIHTIDAGIDSIGSKSTSKYPRLLFTGHKRILPAFTEP
uniref:Uncharacterized protein n=1 Tax=Phlebotomus papatasi TaxID=29031 RepID=A0A1B0EZ42_PHLPP